MAYYIFAKESNYNKLNTSDKLLVSKDMSHILFKGDKISIKQTSFQKGQGYDVTKGSLNRTIQVYYNKVLYTTNTGCILLIMYIRPLKSLRTQNMTINYILFDDGIFRIYE